MTEDESTGTDSSRFAALKRSVSAHSRIVAIVAAVLFLALISAVVYWGQARSERTTATVAEENVRDPVDDPAPEAPLDSDEVEELHADLRTQEPTPLTAGRWRFWTDGSESEVLHEIRFASDGTCSVLGDPVVYAGSYREDGVSVEITLRCRDTARATEDATGAERVEEVEWVSVFEMTRDGNTLTGPYETEEWTFDFHSGLERSDARVIAPAAFGRPKQ